MGNSIGHGVEILLAPVVEAGRRPSALKVLLDDLGFATTVDDATVAAFADLFPVTQMSALSTALEGGDPITIARAALAAATEVFDVVRTL